MKVTKKAKAVPAKLGAAVDLLFTTRQKRLVVQQTIKEMEDLEKRIKDHLINTLPKSDASGVAGKLARAAITSKKVPTVKDWDSLYAYIKQNDAWELLQRRVNNTAVDDRWDAGDDIPGVEAFVAVNVSVTKI
jgi:hypothetical protein